MRPTLEGITYPHYQNEHPQTLDPATIAMSAGAVMLRDTDSYRPTLEREEEPSADTLVERAETMLATIRAHSTDARSRLDIEATTDPRIAQQLKAIDDGTAFEGRDALMSVRRTWIPEIVHHLLRGKPFSLHVDTAHTYSAINTRMQGGLQRGHTSTERLSGLVAGLLRDAIPDHSRMHTLDIIHDFIDPASGEYFDDTSRRRIADASLGILENTAALRPNDAPERTLTVHTKDLPSSALEIGELLAKSNPGNIVVKEGAVSNATWFVPNKSHIESLPGLSAVDRTLLSDPILLAETEKDSTDGTPSPTLLRAASMLAGPNPDDAMRLHIVGAPERQEFLEASILLDAAMLLRHDKQHAIYVDTAYKKNEVLFYAFARMLESEIEKYQATLRHHDDIQNMDSAAYADKCYGSNVEQHEGGILPEDNMAADILANALPPLLDTLRCEADKKGEQTRGIIVGHGPFSFMTLGIESGVELLELSDPARSNRLYIHEAMRGHNLQYNLITKKFEEAYIRHDLGKRGSPRFFPPDASRYHGSGQRLRSKATITSRKFNELPPDTYHIIGDPFAGCSYSPFKTDFFDAVQWKARALKRTPGSFMISLHVIGSKGWDYAGGNFPASELSQDEVLWGYREAGLKIRHFKPLIAGGTLRDGYEGMVLVIAQHA